MSLLAILFKILMSLETTSIIHLENDRVNCFFDKSEPMLAVYAKEEKQYFAHDGVKSLPETALKYFEEMRAKHALQKKNQGFLGMNQQIASEVQNIPSDVAPWFKHIEIKF